MNDEVYDGQLVARPSGDLAPPNPNAGPLGSILADPQQLKEIPIETVERLFDLHEREVAREARNQFFAAFHRVRSSMSPVAKRAENTHTGSKYARVEAIQKMLDPLLAVEGFSYSVSTVEPVVPETMRVCLVLRHVGGHEERHFLDAPPDTKGPGGKTNKTALHGMGSTLTYCGRQLLTQVFGVMLGADDDGNAGGANDEFIDENQIANLVSLIEEVGADRKAFLVYLRVPTLEELPARQYRNAVAALEAKR